MDSQDEARSLPRGELELVLCERCGNLANRAFREELTAYGDNYEDSQAFSPTFTAYARELAAGWVDTWSLAGRVVVEIGAGRGDFSRMLLDAGAGRVVAMDPTIRMDRVGDDAGGRIDWQKVRFDDASGLPPTDAVVFRHVLEHVSDPVGLLSALRRALDGSPRVPVLVEVPDATRILAEAAFWDVYYEHCAYFVPSTVRALFESCGFVVDDISSGFDGQYLLVTARAAAQVPTSYPVPPDLSALASSCRSFAERVEAEAARWEQELTSRAACGQDVVLWGSGSKATAFLTMLADHDKTVSRVVDVNPHKQGRFMLGSGHPIVSPASLAAEPPDLVVVMNPIYRNEIAADLARLGVGADVRAVGEQPVGATGPG